MVEANRAAQERHETVRVVVDGVGIDAPQGATILEAARLAGIEIPTLCYLRELNEIGACRICVVEVEGIDRLVAACNSPVFDGMEVRTDTQRVRLARRTNLQLILSRHDRRCPTCFRNGTCRLQALADRMAIHDVPFPTSFDSEPVDKRFPLVKEPAKCISCLRCVSVCEKSQALAVWALVDSGSRSRVDAVAKDDCSYCGQCITHCPVGALHERSDIARVFDAIGDPDTVTIAQIAPSVRTSWHEGLGLENEEATPGRMVAAVRKLGFDYVFDTDFAADMTIMEEGSELLHRLEAGVDGPMFTSCCPGWVRFLKTRYPWMQDRLSTTKSPQQIFGALAKTYYADLLGIDPSRIFVVSYMPCVAKKAERAYPGMDSNEGIRDVDAALTVRELQRQIKSRFLNVSLLDEEDFDAPLGVATGAGHIFGVTGGVMEAALRSAYFLATGSNPDPDAFEEIRYDGIERGWREKTFDLAGRKLRVAAASGLANADALCAAIDRGEVSYDFVEVMACPGGCVGGGGQPICEGEERAALRGSALRRIDAQSELRFSHENPSVQACYGAFLGEPLSELAERLLHSDHGAWSMPCAVGVDGPAEKS
ncbi:[FeFe] hydrogenase, group A [uncultured Slackia sp.]|uniref:[FeFe] hydrogenase, group A n=1 Tax=uncultured Slackia sp. TaxID=665903 RepID=UPI0026DFC007|nr:[FeFe] hydrogenase, group A [uncultured Slackia sp.]